MTNIIAQIAEKVVEEILASLAEKGITNIEKTAEEMLTVSAWQQLRVWLALLLQ